MRGLKGSHPALAAPTVALYVKALADRDPADILRENAYLKQRNAQLQSDILDLSAEAERLRRLQERLYVRTAARAAGAAGGQPHPLANSDRPGAVAPSTTPEVQALAAGLGEAGDDAALSHYGITRSPIDVFHVGGYRYTSLEEAIAEARRQRAGA